MAWSAPDHVFRLCRRATEEIKEDSKDALDGWLVIHRTVTKFKTGKKYATYSWSSFQFQPLSLATGFPYETLFTKTTIKLKSVWDKSYEVLLLTTNLVGLTNDAIFFV